MNLLRVIECAILSVSLSIINIFCYMGCSSPQNAGLPNIPASHLNRLLMVADINHQLNINKKYQHLAKIDLSQYAGSGFRKTHAYNALTTRDELEAKRKQFWETRVNGEQQVWKLIEMAIKSLDENLALSLLNDNKISMLNGSIQMSIDRKFNKYEVPVFCINEPLTYSEEKIENRNLNMEYQDAKVDIMIRSAKYPDKDIKINEKLSTDVEIIKSTIKAMRELPVETKVRLFYNGREMKDDKTLGNYSYASGTVIQAMII